MVHANPVMLAEFFHAEYERLAPMHSLGTPRGSAVAWADMPENNRNLLIEVAWGVLKFLQEHGWTPSGSSWEEAVEAIRESRPER